MKFRLSFLVMAVACLLSLASCTREEPCMSVKTVSFNINAKNWAYSNNDNNNYFYASVDMPEINKYVLQNGIVKVYRTYNPGKADESQIELPYVRLKETLVGDQWMFYTETVDYEFTAGKLFVYYTESDFEYEIDETFIPENMSFRCVVMY